MRRTETSELQTDWGGARESTGFYSGPVQTMPTTRPHHHHLTNSKSSNWY